MMPSASTTVTVIAAAHDTITVHERVTTKSQEKVIGPTPPFRCASER
jgi:hypothetical protein